MILLGIESSCDETSAAVVKMNDSRILCSNIIASQIDIHKLYGGVVPEIASRAHVEAISNITYKALDAAGVSLNEIDAIGVTNSPGLIGALLVGVNFAKALAFNNSKPLIPVNHIKGHVAANYFAYQDLAPPFLALVASGGHTSIINVKTYTNYETIGRTRDDAIGEAFDKVARVMGLPYPGGGDMDRIAYDGDKNSIKFPSPAISGDNLDFSFSGLKTSVINYIHNCTQKNEDYNRDNVAASFTKTVVEAVIKKTEMAMKAYNHHKLVISGGVAANSHLRNALEVFASRLNIELYLPPKELCGDNAAMIAAQAYYEFLDGITAGTALNAKA